MITDRDDEFRGTITTLYREELGRDPDPDGLAAHLDFARHGGTGAQIRQALHNSPEGVAFRAKPPAPPPVPGRPLYIEISGSNFVHINGQRLVWCGVDQFTAYRLWLDGVSLDPLIQESLDLGFDLWRVFLMGSAPQNKIFTLSPHEGGFYDRLHDFATYLNAAGIVLNANVFVDAQDVLPNGLGHFDHWHHVADALRGTLTLLSGGNQYPKNGFDPFSLTDPGLVWSRGSSTADPPVYEPKPRGASFCEFHPRRDYPAMMMDTVASPVTIQTRDHVGEPLLITEPIGCAVPPYDPTKRSDDPRLFWRLARHYATECAGAVFHNDAGMRGDLMPAAIKDCAVAWVDGMII